MATLKIRKFKVLAALDILRCSSTIMQKNKPASQYAIGTSALDTPRYFGHLLNSNPNRLLECTVMPVPTYHSRREAEARTP